MTADELKKNIDSLTELIEGSDSVLLDNELVHVEEDDIKDSFIELIVQNNMSYNEINEIALKIQLIPEYTKWYA